ncbi:MAG: 1-deoxy-D-xylulose-5-phosphate reductoisomerase [Fimbriimonadaceae bacterium]|nr:1-deoxy-D-xylulose-5-phosphate reductoisomerase [Fimbriimonadaceae bacterium]
MGPRKRVVILGSTGSIGRQTLDVCRRLPDRLEVVGLAARSSEDALAAQAAEFGVEHAVLMGRDGLDALTDLAALPEADLVVVAVAGVIGLRPTLAAVESGKQVALASKEVLVAAGELFGPLLKRHKTLLTPIDSEHSAVFQCLQGCDRSHVQKVVLTASGGPFRGMTRAELKDVTRGQTLAHPTWSMGGKITVDSATLMNKGLEIIEAKWLFDLEYSQVDVVVHPQSVVHSFVFFNDGSALGQLGWPDMRLPIQYALVYPDRLDSGLKPWDPTKTPNLTFEEPDVETFRCLALARRSGETGGTAPAALNAANEAAVAAFLDGRCGFLQIADVVESVLDQHEPEEVTLDSVERVDTWARATVSRELGLG